MIKKNELNYRVIKESLLLKTYTEIKTETLLLTQSCVFKIKPERETYTLFLYAICVWSFGLTRLMTSFRTSTKGLGVL